MLVKKKRPRHPTSKVLPLVLLFVTTIPFSGSASFSMLLVFWMARRASFFILSYPTVSVLMTIEIRRTTVS